MVHQVLVGLYPVKSQHQSQQESHKSQWKPSSNHGQHCRQQQKRQEQLKPTIRRESENSDQTILRMIYQIMKEPNADVQIPPITAGYMGMTFPCYMTSRPARIKKLITTRQPPSPTCWVAPHPTFSITLSGNHDGVGR